MKYRNFARTTSPRWAMSVNIDFRLCKPVQITAHKNCEFNTNSVLLLIQRCITSTLPILFTIHIPMKESLFIKTHIYQHIIVLSLLQIIFMCDSYQNLELAIIFINQVTQLSSVINPKSVYISAV